MTAEDRKKAQWIHDLERQQEVHEHKFEWLDEEVERLQALMESAINGQRDQIRTLIADGMNQLRDVKQELKDAKARWNEVSLKNIGLSDEVSELKAEVTMLVARSTGSDEPAWKKARVGSLE